MPPIRSRSPSFTSFLVHYSLHAILFVNLKHGDLVSLLYFLIKKIS
jgi:hypothetical protein